MYPSVRCRVISDNSIINNNGNNSNSDSLVVGSQVGSNFLKAAKPNLTITSSSNPDLTHAQVLSDGTLQCMVTCLQNDASMMPSSSLPSSQALTVQVAVDGMGMQYLTAGTVACVDAPTIISHSPSMLLEGALVGNFSITVVLADPVVASDPLCVFGSGGGGMESLGLAKTVFYVGPSRYMRVVCAPRIHRHNLTSVQAANLSLGLQTLSIRSGNIVTSPITFKILPMVTISPMVAQRQPGAMMMISSSESLVTIPLTGRAPVDIITSTPTPTYVLVPSSVCLVTRVSDKGVVILMGKTTATLLTQRGSSSSDDGSGDVVGCDMSILSLPTDTYTVEVVLGGVSVGILSVRMFSVPGVVVLQPNVGK